MSQKVYEYEYTIEVTYFDLSGCSFDVTIPYPCGIKWCEKFGISYPCGVKWCTVTLIIPYPCFVTNRIHKTGYACKGKGIDVWSLYRSIYDHQPSKYPDTSLPNIEAGPIDGDLLYSVYRKGLITRHIAKNGRVFPEVALESVDEFDADNYDLSGYINMSRSDGSSYKVPVGNIRYSYEDIADIDRSKTELWVPVLSPIKNPGISNGGRYVVASKDDNPIYYGGGLALAVFSLEAKNAVSKYSIEYARRIVLYFLHSELWQGSGYIIRTMGFFNSGRNINGEPLVQGASPEELLGLMLGLLFYLDAEDNAHPLYKEAKRLRDDVLARVSKGHLWNSYKHPFMISAHNSSYWVKHHEFSLYALKEYRSGSMLFNQIEQLYVSLLTLSVGRSRTLGPTVFAALVGAAIGSIFGPIGVIVAGATLGILVKQYVSVGKFENYMMYLTSMILVLEGNIPPEKKKWFARVFIQHYIKAAITVDEDRDMLKGNLFMACLAKLANKYISGDSESESEEFEGLWGDDYGSYRELVSPLEVNGSIKTSMPKPAGASWQYNLPFKAITGETYGGWIDRNLGKRIGGHFIWRYGNTSYYWHSDRSRWLNSFPGYQGSTDYDWISQRATVNEEEFKNSEIKRYTSVGYYQKDIVEIRQHKDNQNEGAGLDLLFMRMFLTHINKDAYPAPKLTQEYDKQFPVLPYAGAEPLDPIIFYKTYEYSTKDESCGTEKIHGDKVKAMRIMALGEERNAVSDYIIAYANKDEKMVLKHGFVSGGQNPDIPEGLYLDTKGTTWNRFDKACLGWTKDNSNENILILVERAEGDRTIELSTSIFRRKHWLRVSIWKVPPFGVGRDPNPTILDLWESSAEHVDAVKDIDLAVINHDNFAVFLRTRRDKDRLYIFKIDFANNQLHQQYSGVVNNVTYSDNLGITTAYKDILIYTYQQEGGWHLASYKWDGNSLEDKYQYQYQSDGHRTQKLIGITTVRDAKEVNDEYPDGKQYVISVISQYQRGNNASPAQDVPLPWYITVYSHLVRSDGTLEYKGSINTTGKYEGEKLLTPREGDWEYGSVKSFYANSRIPGFAICGKGVGREMRDRNGDWVRTPKALKIVYGYLLPDGRPTLEASNLAGSGKNSAMKMLDVTSTMSDGIGRGVVTVNKTKRYGGFLGLFGSYYMTLRYWKFHDNYQDMRWEPGD